MLLGFDSRGQPIISQNPKGELPNLGNGIDRHPWLKVFNKLNQLRNSPTYRIGIDHNIDPEVNKLLGNLLGPHAKEQIDAGKLLFHVEIPGYNSDRVFLGFTKKL